MCTRTRLEDSEQERGENDELSVPTDDASDRLTLKDSRVI